MRLFFLVFIIGFTFVLIAEFSKLHQTISQYSESDKIEIVILDILHTRIGKTKYLAKLTTNANNSVEATGLDYLYMHRISSKVKAYKTNQGIKIFYWNNTAAAITYFLGLISIYLFLLSLFIQIPDFKNRYMPIYQSKLFFLIFIFFAFGNLFLSNYLYSEARVFIDGSIKTAGTLVKFEEKICKSENDDGKEYSFPCYSKVFSYQSSDGRMHSYSSPYISSKDGLIGEKESLFYLKSNPSFVKTVSPNRLKLRALLLMGFCILLLFGLRYAWKTKMRATIN